MHKYAKNMQKYAKNMQKYASVYVDVNFALAEFKLCTPNSADDGAAFTRQFNLNRYLRARAGRPGHPSAGPARTTVIDRCQVSVAVSLELLRSESLSESPSEAAGCGHWQCHAESNFGMGWSRRTASESLPALSGLRPP